jgi:hypothetical protein
MVSRDEPQKGQLYAAQNGFSESVPKAVPKSLPEVVPKSVQSL